MFAAKELCKSGYEAFGCAGQAANMTALSLESMAERYARGELDPVVH
jgi:fructose-bisphosphate aldolase class II